MTIAHEIDLDRYSELLSDLDNDDLPGYVAGRGVGRINGVKRVGFVIQDENGDLWFVAMAACAPVTDALENVRNFTWRKHFKTSKERS